MTDKRNLVEVLASLNVFCDGIEYGFTSIKDGQIDFNNEILGVFREKEGLTIIAPKPYFEKNNIPHESSYAKLTIETHTSLELVGLTAVLTKKLADNKISANVVAGFFHDHIFVQYGTRQKAIEILNALKMES